MSQICTIFLIIQLFVIVTSINKIVPLVEWKNLVFGFDSLAQEEYAIAQGFYNRSEQIRPYDADYTTKVKKMNFFVSVPRVRQNAPYTLAIVTQKLTEKGPVLAAYPNIDVHLNRTCDGIFSVFRFSIDNICNNLWAIDSGRDFSRAGNTQVCPPKIIIIDLSKNKIIHTYEIPSEQYTDSTVFNSITLLPKNNCKSTIAYVTDARGAGLVVYNSGYNRSWRINNELFAVDHSLATATIAGEQFTLPDGLYTVAPSLVQNALYFHGFSSLKESFINLKVVNNETFWLTATQAEQDAQFYTIGYRPTQSATEAVDPFGNLWFTLFEPLAIMCWNTKYEYKYENFKIVYKNEHLLQFAAGLKIKQNFLGLDTVVIALTNRLQKHATGTINSNEINYRILLGNAENCRR